jgi:recombination protein RecT
MTQVSTQQQKPVSVAGMLSQESIKKRFEDILGDNAESFVSSIISATKSNPKLAQCDPNSVISSAVIAATLKLPINSNLGFAHIVPYNGLAQFQMGWKGFVQLAQRTGQYKTINAIPVYANQLKSSNPLTGEYEFDFSKPSTGEVIGYAGYFKLISGFEKTVYWNVGKMIEHAKEYSSAYKYDLKAGKKSSVWSTNFDSMALKTVVKNMLSQWGILSIEIQTAFEKDQQVVDQSGNATYADNIVEATHEDVTDQAAIAETATTTEANTNAGNGATVNIPSADNL